MPSVLDAMSETVEAWLIQEEQALAKLTRRSNEPAVAERLNVWKERVKAYERFEAVIAEGRATLARDESGRPSLPAAVEAGLHLVA